MTLKKLRINIGKNDRSYGLCYVAFSRVTTLDGLLIDSIGFGEDRLLKCKLHEDMYDHDKLTRILEEETENIIEENHC